MTPRVLRNFQMFSAGLLAFLIPISKLLTSYAIVLWVVSSLLMWQTKGKSKWSKRGLWALIAFYIFHLTGLIHTTNFDYAFLDLGMKVSFLLMPLIWLGSRKFSSRQTDLVMSAFTIGVLVVASYSVVNAFIKFSETGSQNVFYYTDFATMHPSYLSMYALFAFSYIVLSLSGKRLFLGIHRKWIYALILLFLLIYINLLASKAGVLLAPVAIVILSILIARFRKSAKKGLVYAASLLAVFGVSLFFSTQTINRIKNMITITAEATEDQNTESNPGQLEPEDTESTTARITTWTASLRVIEKNWLFGTGTGDVKIALAEEYTAMGQFELAEDQLNSHNQYLQTWAALGIFGTFALVLTLLFGLFEAIRKDKNLLFLFIFIISANIFVESMLEVQGGIVFFAFFFGLLITSTRSKERFVK
ncbi:O-antigen ligase family protein [Halocola ammonii]